MKYHETVRHCLYRRITVNPGFRHLHGDTITERNCGTQRVEVLKIHLK